LLEAVRAELKKTPSGQKLLAEAHAFANEFGELVQGITPRNTPRAGDLRVGERLTKFRQQYGDQFLAAQARHAYLQPSVNAVAQILRPEIAAQTEWVSEASFRRPTLLRPRARPKDVGTLTQGLGDEPPLVQSCSTPPYGESDFNLVPAAITDASLNGGAGGNRQTGTAEISGNAETDLVVPVGVYLASAFWGQDFPVPPGPTSYKTTISYDWQCWGGGAAFLGIAIVNVDLAIVIDKRDGTRETHAREVTLQTLPAFALDTFDHVAEDVKVTIPFTRDGSNGTVRIMVGADGQCTVIGWAASATFHALATIREICVTSVS
jgi:hypothetical protein